MLMYLNEGDKMIVHYILNSYCRDCSLDIDNYLSYNQFVELCPIPHCKNRELLKELVRSHEHHNIKDYLGVEYPFNDQWKRFFNYRTGWT